MHRSIEWAVGLFDGEGYITRSKDKRCNSIQYKVGIEMTDKDLIDEFHSFWGEGTRHERKRPGFKPSYIWQTGQRELVRRILIAMLPHLGQRRAYKALNILDELELEHT